MSSILTPIFRSLVFFIAVFLAFLAILHQNPNIRHLIFSKFQATLSKHQNEKMREFKCNLIQQIRGDHSVLEIGPGTGSGTFSCLKCHEYFAVEPNPHSIAELRKTVEKELVPKGIKVGGLYATTASNMSEIESNSIDSVIMLHVMCSVPREEEEKVLREIHRVLKVGGKLLFLEHTRAWKDISFVARLQGVLEPVWKILFDGCQFKKTWENVEWLKEKLGMDVKYEQFEADFMPIFLVTPHVAGVATKQ